MTERVQPINSIEWVDVEKLSANDYNPNVVYTAEMKLLELSLCKQGWIQPILVTQDYVVIDGFHRSTLAKTSPRVREMTGGKVPCVVMQLTEPERMLLTIRINRAKGSHIAVKMSDIIKALVNDHGCDLQYIAQSIGASKDEVELLLQDGVFSALKIPEHQYSRAWVPK